MMSLLQTIARPTAGSSETFSATFSAAFLTAAVLLLGAPAVSAQERVAGARKPAETVALAPHRAFYELSLLKTTADPSAPAGASGGIAYDFVGSACEGYTTRFIQDTDIEAHEGESLSTQMRSTSFESGDHSTFTFRIESGRRQDEPEIVEGAAFRESDGSLSIDLKRPRPFKSDTDHEAVFPTHMMIRALEAARAGQATYSTKLYDGTSSGDRVFQTLSVLGRESVEPLADATKDAPAMKGMRRWRATVSYFDVAKPEDPPVYVLSFQMWENGVSSDLILDYGNFQMKGALTKLELLPVKECGK